MHVLTNNVGGKIPYGHKHHPRPQRLGSFAYRGVASAGSDEGAEDFEIDPSDHP